MSLTQEQRDKLASSYKGTSLKSRFQSEDYYEDTFPSYNIPNISQRKTLRVLYGKVSSKSGNPVTVKEEYLSQLNVEGSHFVLDIVKECFDEMVNYHSKLLARGKLYRQNTMFETIEVEKAYQPVQQKYSVYINKLLDYLSDPEGRFYNYYDYENYAINTVKSMATSLPITLSEFIINNSTPSNVTGLVIDLKTSSYSDDLTKHTNYLSDKNYSSFKKIAKRFGFIIDKNAPWRLIYNLRSPYVLNKMLERGLSGINDFFERYYEETTLYEHDYILNIIYTSYLYYQQHSVTISFPCESPTSGRILKKSRVVQPPPPRDYVLDDFSRVINSYITIRAYETRKRWSQADFARVFDSTMKVYKYKGMTAALKFVSSKFSNRSWEVNSLKGLTSGNHFDNIPVKNSGIYDTNINYSGGGGSSGSGY